MTYKVAIEELRDGLDTHTEYYLGNQVDRELAEICIKALEKCQKVEKSFEWCTDCKEYDKDKHCCHRWSKRIRETIGEIEEHYKKLCKKQEKIDDYIDIIKNDDEHYFVDKQEMIRILESLVVEE